MLMGQNSTDRALGRGRLLLTLGRLGSPKVKVLAGLAPKSLAAWLADGHLTVSSHDGASSVLLFFFLSIYLFIYREKGREGETEGEKQ